MEDGEMRKTSESYDELPRSLKERLENFEDFEILSQVQ